MFFFPFLLLLTHAPLSSLSQTQTFIHNLLLPQNTESMIHKGRASTRTNTDVNSQPRGKSVTKSLTLRTLTHFILIPKTSHLLILVNSQVTFSSPQIYTATCLTQSRAFPSLLSVQTKACTPSTNSKFQECIPTNIRPCKRGAFSGVSANGMQTTPLSPYNPK